MRNDIEHTTLLYNHDCDCVTGTCHIMSDEVAPSGVVFLESLDFSFFSIGRDIGVKNADDLLAVLSLISRFYILDECFPVLTFSFHDHIHSLKSRDCTKECLHFLGTLKGKTLVIWIVSDW